MLKTHQSYVLLDTFTSYKPNGKEGQQRSKKTILPFIVSCGSAA